MQQRSKKFLAGLAVATTLLSAGLLFGSVGFGVRDEIRRTLDWRDQEYNKLKALHAGYTRAKFESVLGEPVFDRPTRNGRFREQTFLRREHWVQTISTRGGSVVLYAVTACGREFRPEFDVPGATATGSAKVELNVSKPSDVARAPELQLDYYGSGATANSRFYEIQAGSNPSNYKWFIWGINDVCPDWFSDVYPAIREETQIPSDTPYRGSLREAPEWAGRFRAGFAVNTFAETAPQFDVRSLPRQFQIGADRILTRTTGKDLG